MEESVLTDDERLIREKGWESVCRLVYDRISLLQPYTYNKTHKGKKVSDIKEFITDFKFFKGNRSLLTKYITQFENKNKSCSLN